MKLYKHSNLDELSWMILHFSRVFLQLCISPLDKYLWNYHLAVGGEHQYDRTYDESARLGVCDHRVLHNLLRWFHTMNDLNKL